jgi:retron-type reverse transcriptase
MGWEEKAMSDKSSANGSGESYSAIVLAKPPNEGRGGPQEVVEGRALTKENEVQADPCRTPGRASGPSGLSRVREAAKKDGKLRFTALLHHVNTEQLRASYYSLKKQAAPGVDGVTWEEYGSELEARIGDLQDRLQRGAYRARPSRRVWIPKPDGRQRPLGIAALEDKIAQHATGKILNQIWEEDFLGFSYGFRPGRSQHDALDALQVAITRKRVNWIVDLDIRSFFDKISHDWMIRFVEHRIGDRRIVRLIQKWLKAGVLEQGRWSETEEGTPQGAVMTA